MASNADIKMNEFPAVTDGAYIYAEAADGSQVKISRSDLVQVIKAHIGITGMNYLGAVSDYNQMTNTGVYQTQGASAVNAPHNDTSITVVFAVPGSYILQICGGLNTGNIYARAAVLPNGFKPWVKLN